MGTTIVVTIHHVDPIHPNLRYQTKRPQCERFEILEYKKLTVVLEAELDGVIEVDVEASQSTSCSCS